MDPMARSSSAESFDLSGILAAVEPPPSLDLLDEDFANLVVPRAWGSGGDSPLVPASDDTFGLQGFSLPPEVAGLQQATIAPEPVQVAVPVAAVKVETRRAAAAPARAESGRAAAAAPADTQPSTAGVGSEHDEADAPEETGPKKRRRTRDSHQQALNRLAQQRYRQRKKEKQSELEQQLAELQDKTKALTLLEGQLDQLRLANDELQGQVAKRDAELAQAEADLKAARERCTALEAQVSAMEQARPLALPSGLDVSGLSPQALSDRLLAVIKVALEDVEAGGQQPDDAAGSALTSDALVAQISRTLTSCCRELLGGASHGAASPVRTASPGAPPAIPVSCC